MTSPNLVSSIRVSVFAVTFVQFAILFASFFSVQAFSQTNELRIKSKSPTPIFVLPLTAPETIKGLHAISEKTKLSHSLPENDAELFAAATTFARLPRSFLCRKDGHYEDFTKGFQLWALTLDANSIERLAINLNTEMKTKLNLALSSGEAADLAAASDAGRSVFFTRAGADAMSLYASYLFERGRYLLAAAHFLEIVELQTALQKKLGKNPAQILAAPLSDSLKFKAVASLRRAQDLPAADKLFRELFGAQKTFLFGKKEFNLDEVEKELARPGPTLDWLVVDYRNTLFRQAPVQRARYVQVLVSLGDWLPGHLKNLEARANFKTPMLDGNELLKMESYIDIPAFAAGQECASGYRLFTSILPNYMVQRAHVAMAIVKLRPSTEIFDDFANVLIDASASRPGDSSATKNLTDFLFDELRPEVVKELLYTMGPRASPHLLKGFTHQTALVRIESIKLVGRIFRDAPATLKPDFDALWPHFARLLENEDLALRKFALETLGDIGPSAKISMPVILACLKDKDADVRLFALRALTFWGEAASESLNEVLKSLDDTVATNRLFALDIILALNKRSAIPALKGRLAVESNPFLKDKIITVLHALEKLGKE